MRRMLVGGLIALAFVIWASAWVTAGSRGRSDVATSGMTDCTGGANSGDQSAQRGANYAKGFGTTYTTGGDCAGARVEVYIMGLPDGGGPRTCVQGQYASVLGSCVETGSVSQVSAAEEEYPVIGQYTMMSNHWVIGNDSAWVDVEQMRATTLTVYSSNNGGGGGDDPPLYFYDDGTPVDCWAHPEICSPILIPTGPSQAYKLTSAAEGVRFDLDADGRAEQTAWTAPGDRLAFLAFDRNNNGTIDNGTELFGGRTVAGKNNGFEALIALSGSTQGFLDTDDALYHQLLLWVDVNHNGVSEPEELSPFEAQYARIGLGWSLHNRRDGFGNQYRYRGWVEARTKPGKNMPANGAEHALRVRSCYDVVFVR